MLDDWLNSLPSTDLVFIATTRIKQAQFLEALLKDLPLNNQKVGVLVGPEGGWTEEEIIIAEGKGCISVSLSDTILRTSTAAISATQIMLSWRRNKGKVC